ncbi:hypothetical protein [Treponema bryantii]|uniref:hypothetical protein n=1 Tax=Treponema bryantii TaxID=163 RepID=UPI0003B2FC9C|nr:hypothetical protein [Treponema bryantii]
MSSLEGKKVLFFAPKFFNYEISIKEEMEKQGAIVHLYDERNNPSSIEKVLLRKAHFLMANRIYRYYTHVAKENNNFYPDYILFVNPEAVTKNAILYLRKIYPMAKLILYMWDSLENKKIKTILYLFDKKLSFDHVDCKKYGFIFRPLFFIKSFEKNLAPEKKEFDFTFIGTAHSDRAKILNKLRVEFNLKNLKYYYYVYVPGKLMLFLRTITDFNFRRLRKFGLVHTESLTKEKITSIVGNSKYIIDINHPKQRGLTMRTIEMLGAHKKILTTNENIEEYDFYNPRNQIIIDRKKVCVDKSLVNENFEPVSEEIYKKYMLSEWIKEVFNNI